VGTNRNARSKASTGPASSAARVTVIGAALVVATLAAYSGVRACGFVRLDDFDYVTGNAMVLRGLTWEGVRWAFTTFHAGNSDPLTWLSHMLDVELYGTRPLGHHATSVALHVANTLLLWLALARLTRAVGRSAVVAALFALHPLHVESVAWVAERKDVLSALFFFATLLAYARYVEKPGTPRMTIVAVALALGLLAKPMLVTTPFVLLLLDRWPLARAWSWKLVREKVPLFALAGAASLAAFLAQRAGGAVATLESLPLGERAVGALVAYARYLALAIWPSGLCAYYPLQRPSALAMLVASAVVATLSWLAWRERSRRPALSVGWLWYLGMLVPVIGLVQIGAHSMADRFTYLPLIGPFLAIVWLVDEALARQSRGVRATIALSALAPLALLTARQVSFWKDSITLFQRVLDVTEDNAVAEESLGDELVKSGRVEEGLSHLRRAIQLRPGFAQAHNELGAALHGQHRFDEALVELRAAVANRPGYADAWYNIGLASNGLGRDDDAREAMRKAVELRPEWVEARANLASLLLASGAVEPAFDQYRAAASLQPQNALLHRRLATTAERLGRIDVALSEYDTLLRLAPDDVGALVALARIRATHSSVSARNGVMAVKYAERAASIARAPDAGLQGTLAAAYAEAGRFAAAVAACERAVAIAEQAHDDKVAQQLRAQLELYKAGQPYHAPAQ
jgi:tetratricopeptide (TPR) repeat protein